MFNYQALKVGQEAKDLGVQSQLEPWSRIKRWALAGSGAAASVCQRRSHPRTHAAMKRARLLRSYGFFLHLHSWTQELGEHPLRACRIPSHPTEGGLPCLISIQGWEPPLLPAGTGILGSPFNSVGCRFRMFSERVDDRSWKQIYLQAVLVEGLLVWVLVIWNTLREFWRRRWCRSCFSVFFFLSDLPPPQPEPSGHPKTVWWQGSNGDLGCKNLTLNSEGKRMSDFWDSSLSITACLPPADMRPQGDPAETALYVPQRHGATAAAQSPRACCERKVAFNKEGLKTSSFSSFFIPVFLPFPFFCP